MIFSSIPLISWQLWLIWLGAMSSNRRVNLAIASLYALGFWLSPLATLPSFADSKILGEADNFSLQQADILVSAIAKQVTVRIFTNPGLGSGVIIARQGQTYTVLTCAHVVEDTRDRRYTVLTSDGVKHQAKWLRNTHWDTDLALVQFRSNQDYQVVAIGDSNSLSVGDPVYASGFPNWHWVNENAIEDTRQWGLKAFVFTTGEVGMIPALSLPEGYQLGYTNDIENGMSGGPVLDRQGKLIAINGRLKYPLQGIDGFKFSNGTLPSVELFEQMEALSWAIPIDTFKQKVEVFNNFTSSL